MSDRMLVGLVIVAAIAMVPIAMVVWAAWQQFLRSLGPRPRD